MRYMLILAMLAPWPGWAADADIFHPSGSMAGNTGTLQGSWPRLGPDGPSVGLFTWLAEDPVVFGYSDGSEQAILGSVFGGTVYGAWTVSNLARFEAYLNLYPYAEAPLTGFHGAALGDAEIRALIPMVDVDDAFALSLEPMIGIPTGTADAYLRRGAQAGLYAVVGGQVTDRIAWLSEVGVVGAQKSDLEGVAMGSSFDALAGAWYEVEHGFRFGGDAFFTAGLASGPQQHALFTAHGFAQMASPTGIAITVGGGGGLGVGAPEYRVFASMTWAKITADADHDGLADDVDDCPDDKEDIDGFEDEDGCPDLDNDGDGLSDAADACPDVGEDPDGFDDGDGCPDLDNDADGIDDTDDLCPDDAGDAAMAGCPDPDGDGVSNAEDACPEEVGPAEAQGCPDGDGDLVPDFRDACPDVPAPKQADPRFSDGCAAAAFVTTDGTITITDKVHFDDGSAALRPDARPILDRVAAILAAHEDIDLLEVAGHTDNRGTPDSNQTLSEQRAEAVALYLADKGVQHRRLMPQGYGQTQPIDTNRTTAGRANNRRIEFVIRRWAGEQAEAPQPDVVPEAPQPDVVPEEPQPDVVPEEEIWR